MTYLRREIAQTVAAALHDMPVVAITGMRQTGKSTFLENQPELAGRRFVSLDDLASLAAARENPDAFIAGDGPLTIDEAQRCPELFLAIKRAVDRDRRPGRFLLSGSANFLLMRDLADSLAGRAVYFRLSPLTRRELAGQTAGTPLLKRLMDGQEPELTGSAASIDLGEVVRGGMPTVALGGLSDTGLWFRGYEQTYLERDIRDLSRIGNLVAFRNLLRLAALRSGQVLSQSELARDAGLSHTTVASHLSLAELSCVACRVPPYLRSQASRLIKSPKLFFCDSGLACFLAGIHNLADHPLKGAMLETYVAQNLQGILETSWPLAQLCFWSIQGRREVDFVIEAGGACLAIEVKSASQWGGSDLGGLKAFLERTPQCVAGVLAHNGTSMHRLGERLWTLPLSVLLS
jgi:predicted AAA+ superfamily ATPase